MGVLNEFLAMLRDFQHAGDDVMEDVFQKKRYSSISKRSKEGIMQFPTIVSRSIDIDTLQTVNKALEKQFASFAQTAISMSPFLNLNKDKDAAGYIRKFHQNPNKGSLKDDFLNVLTYSDVNESFILHSDESEEVLMFTAIGEGTTPEVIKANKKALINMMEGIRESVLNDTFIPKQHRRITDDYIRAKHTPVLEKTRGPKNPTIGTNIDARGTKISGATLTNKVEDMHVGSITNNYNIKGGGAKGLVPGGAVNQQLPNRVLVDNDVKKANELVPTSMHVRTTLVNSAGEVQGNLDFIAGVKATMHPVNSDEMVSNIVEGMKSSNKLFKFIRWTTGEIAFARDYLLNLTEIKEDVARTRDRNTKWFTALKRRKRLAKVRNAAFFVPGDLLPNASIVLSIEEADFIKSNYGYDLFEPTTVDKLLREYFLISVTIVDVASQQVHFYFDGDEDFQTVTISALERGDSNGDKINFKDVLKLVQRV